MSNYNKNHINGRKYTSMDNTPYWAVDPCRWDMAYMHVYRKYAEVRFDVSKQDTV